MALGRGLDSLIPRAGSARLALRGSATDSGGAVFIAVSAIRPNPYQPRRDFKQEDLDALAVSIKEHGLLQPIVVCRDDAGGYVLVAGERRWRAVCQNGESEILAVVRTADDQQKLELALIENLQREDLNALEQAQGIKKLIDEFGMRQREVCRRMGKSAPVVSSLLSLLRLPQEIQQALLQNEISYKAARSLGFSMSGAGEAETLKAFHALKEAKVGSQDLERQLPRASNRKDKHAGNKLRHKMLDENEKALCNVFGTKVVVTSTKNRGRICLEFYSEEELHAAIERLLSLGA